MVERYYISAVYEKDGKTPKHSHQYWLGKSGKIALLQKNSAMWFVFDEEVLIGNTLTTSPVEKFEKTDDIIMVYTQNSVYKLVIV